MLCQRITALLLAAAQAVNASFETDVQKILQRPAFQNATVGVEIRSLESGETVFSHNAHLSLTPASNQKLLTSSVALTRLGADFRYNTTVLATQEPDSAGKLGGDIWLQGTGDPSLSSARLEELAKQIADAGVKKITGKVIGDGSLFDNQVLGTGWAWDDEPYYYSAQVDGLNCDGNVVAVTVAPGDVEGDKVKVKIDNRDASEDEYVKVEATAVTGGSEGISLGRRRGINTITVSGSIPVGADPVADQVTIEEPSSFAASRFALALQSAGVEVSDAPTKPGLAPNNGTKLATSTSEPLSKLLKLFLKPSDNLYGEALIKTVGYAENSGGPGSAASGVAAAQSLFKEAGIDYSGVLTVDGSGLSAMDTVTPRFICDLLSYVDGSFSKGDRSLYLDALPIGGVDGTLASRFQDTPLEGNVRGKTGTLSGASSLSGYLTAKNGDRYVFSILMNHASDSSEAVEGQDDIAMALYSI